MPPPAGGGQTQNNLEERRTIVGMDLEPRTAEPAGATGKIIQ